MAGIVKTGKTPERRTRSQTGEPSSLTAMDVWAPRIAAIISFALLLVAAWLLIQARPWAQ